MSKIQIKKKGKMYECQAFFDSSYPKKWKYVRDLNSFAQFLNKSHSSWKYFNVYEKGTKQYMKRFYPGNVIPKTLLLLVLFSHGLLTQKFTFGSTSNTFTSEGILYPLKNTFSRTTFSKATPINGIYYSATIPTLQDSKKERVCTL